MDDTKQPRGGTLIATEFDRAKRLALREIAKVDDRLTDTLGAIERYVKKHPRQAAAVTLSLGAALGAAGALIFRGKAKK
jgi:ElaB/YqjD/DUF883 family membrane-anchored ribosome-binding protein